MQALKQNKQAFLFVFPGILAGFFILFNILPINALFAPIIEITGQVATHSSQMLGIPATWENNNWTIGVLTIAGFKMLINIECTAVHFMFIFIAAVLASPGKPIKDKGIGLVAGLSILFIVNTLRIIMAGIAGSISLSTFEITHNFIWKGLYILLTFFLWYAWVNNMRFMDISARKIGRVTGVLLLVYTLMYFLTTPYTSMIYLITPLLLNGILDMGIIITQTADRLVFSIDGSQQLLILPNMFMDSILFYVLTILTMSRWGHRRFLRSLGLGFILMLGMHLIVFTLVAAMYPAAIINKASTTLTMKALAISTSYLLWHGMHYNKRKSMETHPFHEHDE